MLSNSLKSKLLLALSATLLTTVAASAAQGPKNPNDPYEPNEIYSAGSHRGQRIPFEPRRSLKIISETKESVRVANFAHQGHYYIADIPKNAVTQILFQTDYFTSEIPAAHAEVRLKFDHAVRLQPQKKNEQNLPNWKISDIIISIEAVKDVSTPFSLVQGLQNEFTTSYRFISASTKYTDVVCKEKERVTQHILKLSAAERESFLIAAIRKSDSAGISEMYNTWTRNCTTEIFRLLDEATSPGAYVRLRSAARTLGAHYPVFAQSSLRARYLLGAEVSEFRDDPTVRVKCD
ncbi:MAG: DUF4105 domain-containing protein [Cryobacterium sp.]|nr:DUF4105 domain-containing protein [Oligoflexia bacterium]